MGVNVTPADAVADLDAALREDIRRLGALLGQALASQCIQQRLGIKKIDMTRATLHKQKDHVFGLTQMMWNFGRRRIRTLRSQ